MQSRLHSYNVTNGTLPRVLLTRRSTLFPSARNFCPSPPPAESASGPAPSPPLLRRRLMMTTSAPPAGAAGSSGPSARATIPPTSAARGVNPPSTPASSLPPASADFRRRRVVSSFLCAGTPGSPSFLISLFKRSPNLRTYPGMWAACSGSIEPFDPSPRGAALREISEETGLAPPQIEGLGEAGMFELRDEGLRTVWEIWPFLFRVVEGGEELAGEGAGGEEGRLERLKGRIRLDWEHTEMRFVSVETMRGMDTVTDLQKSLDVVLEAMKGV